MTRRNTVRIISFLIAALITLFGFMLRAQNELRHYRLELQNGYSRSLDGLNSSVNNIAVTLNKAEFITAPRYQSRIAAYLLTEAENAKTALAELPLGGSLDTINRFLSQVGNYAMTISKSLIGGEEITKDYYENIKALKNTAEKISVAVENSNITYNNPEHWAKEMEVTLEKTVDKNSLSGALDEIDQSLSDYPTLIYDGPYSDHLLEKEPLMLKKATKVSENTAKEKALLVTEEENLGFDELAKGKISAYRFSGEGISVAISEYGGYPVYMRKTREMGDSILEYKQALSKAKRYLEKIGMNGFTDTYYFIDEGVCVINFAFLDGKTICYTDLVKVGVALDDGEVLLLETGGYLANHTERAFESVTASADEAAEKVSQNLKIRETALALIPTDSGGEIRCYEFLCETDDGQEILVYINALSLEQEEVLILLKNGGGILVK